MLSNDSVGVFHCWFHQMFECPVKKIKLKFSNNYIKYVDVAKQNTEKSDSEYVI